MSHLIKLSAKKTELSPAYLKDAPERGMFFCGEIHSEYVGGQCAQCNTIIWAAARANTILNETRPSGVPDFGPDWTKYFYSRQERFLKSLPPCPECGNQHFDRFVWDRAWARFTDGSEFDANTMVERLVELDPSTVEVWVLEDTEKGSLSKSKS